MSLIDVDSLLAPVDAERICGVELDYDADYLALERSVEGTPERQYGDTVIAAEGPDWSRVLAQAISLLGRSKDFRLTVFITRALAHKHGLEGALTGARLVLELAQRHWTEAYPALSVDGEEDPLPRSNALSGLAAVSGLLGDLRATPLPTRQLGPLDLGILEKVAAGRDPNNTAPIARHQIEAFLTEEIGAGNKGLAALRELRGVMQELDRIGREQMGASEAPELQPLIAFIDQVYPLHLQRKADGGGGGDVATADTGSDYDAVPVAAAAAGVPRQALTRQDAVRMLDSVCEFLEATEPANPAPLLIRRARGLIGLDFLSILRELAPDGLAQAELLAGSNRN
ncbi:type VI secretion system protein ImpA [Tahibacter aquaticus]|uniref:Type VI secretion system protein ImpA n=1 Tax=Tahibacter aquaticus TaxID=520092 RepID=A0A4R6Z7T1_9GAMM|nr:type VI secretion system protein TssA [Tahibacter aquaticus]TDR47867.1 type VI secretion system protein ImpA [Tahibacter aquaticus]